MNSSAPFRYVNVATWEVDVKRADSGCMYMYPLLPLGSYPLRLTDRLDEWATRAPARPFLAERDPSGDWRTVTYADFRAQARAIAQALLDHGLSAERPIAVLSGNSIEHALLMIGAMYAGVPYAPISPAYSLLSSDFGKLTAAISILKPGMVFAADGEKFRRAIEAAVPPNVTLAVTNCPVPRYRTELFSALLSRHATDAVDRACEQTTADTVAKLLFTSGSTAKPKGVINTQRMLCSNQEMMRTAFPVLAEEPPVVCDWLPWHHTFGGNHNLGAVLYNGGTLYIDGGKPTPPDFGETIRNLRDVSPTVYFNVPKGYEMLAQSLREDTHLRRNFFRNLKLNFYAAASLSQRVWDELDALSLAECGERIRMFTGLGMTETAPFAMSATKGTGWAGFIGWPAPGMALKLVPLQQKMEARYRGPNITPGFWRQEELTREVFDEEGFFRSGDAFCFLDPGSPEEGLIFDGRITEDFKLSTGTWVSVGPLRLRFLSHCAPFARDVVFAGHDRDEVTALIFPEWEECGRLLKNDAKASLEDAVRATFEALLTTFAESSTGASSRIVRAVIVSGSPSFDAGESTDKGTINQGAVLAHRAPLVEDLYRIPPPPHVLVVPVTPHDRAGRHLSGQFLGESLL